jgi:hypothetical protein
MSSWDPTKTTATVYQLSDEAKIITGHERWVITNHYQPVPCPNGQLHLRHTLVGVEHLNREPELFAFHNNYGPDTDTLRTVCVQEWAHDHRILKMFEVDRGSHYELWCEEGWSFGVEVQRYANGVMR